MRASRVPVALALLAALGAALVAVRVTAVPPQPSAEVVLEDSGLTVAELVDVVRAGAADVHASDPDRDLRIALAAELHGGHERPFVAGRQQDEIVWVRVDGVAMPTRTLIHELTHALAPGAGHGDTFRTIYLAAIDEMYDEATASREQRRLAWVYDRCYLDDSCPEVRTSEHRDQAVTPRSVAPAMSSQGW